MSSIKNTLSTWARWIKVSMLTLAAVAMAWLLSDWVYETRSIEHKSVTTATILLLAVGFLHGFLRSLQDGWRYARSGAPELLPSVFFVSILAPALTVGMAIAAARLIRDPEPEQPPASERAVALIPRTQLLPVRYVTSPWMQFAPAALIDRNLRFEDIDRHSFRLGSVSVADDDATRIQEFIKFLAPCIDAANGQFVRLSFYGFASDEAYYDDSDRRREDSDAINVYVANLRAESAKTAFEKASDGRAGLEVTEHRWTDFLDMAEMRDGDALKQSGVFFGTHRQGRAVVARIVEAGTCEPMLLTKPTPSQS
jgi:hypothetical protein